MRLAVTARFFLLVLLGLMSLAPVTGVDSVRAQGFGEFSVPPPEAVKRAPPKPVRKQPPRRTPKASAPSRYEELTWFSRPMRCAKRSQACGERANWHFQAEFDADYYLELTIPSSYCSPLTLKIELDGRTLGASGLLGPGKSELLALGRLSKGRHSFRISAIGSKGGCNRGVLERWGVDLMLTNNPAKRSLAKAPSQSIPTGGERGRAPEPPLAVATPPTPAPVTPPARITPAASREPAPSRTGSRRGAIHVVNVSGRNLSDLNAISLMSSLSIARDRGARAVAVNMEVVENMTSHGLDALIQGERMYGAGNLVLVRLTGPPRDFLEEQAPGRFRVYSSKAAAVTALRR